jgi:alpha-maltose-1-phosphate synthase
MKVWLPYTQGGSGSDVFTRILAGGLLAAGHEAIEQAFKHHWQYFPWALKSVPPPSRTDCVIANSWNGFVFHRPPLPLITVEHLFVLDPALRPYRNFAQAIFHETLVRHFEKASMRVSDVQVAVSEYTANAHHGVLHGSMPQVIINGIDTDFFTPPPTGHDRLGNRPVRLLFVGNLTRRKGVDLIAPIMRELGAGFDLEYAVGRRTTVSLAAIPNAHVLGRLDQRSIREAYRRADLLLFPTRLEGLPLVAIEAMACATPVVATRTSSLPEVIDDGVTGRLCLQDNPAAFASAIRELAAQPDALVRMGGAARQAAVVRFGIRRMVDEYVALLSVAHRAGG